MKSPQHRIAPVSTPAGVSLPHTRSGFRSRREDRIFQAILPISLHPDAFAPEAPGDWGNRILSEGDLSGSLVA
jgi:hypothetical protein